MLASLEIGESLLSLKKQPLISMSKGYHGMTACQNARLSWSCSILTSWKEKTIDLNAKNDYGMTPNHYAWSFCLNYLLFTWTF